MKEISLKNFRRFQVSSLYLSLASSACSCQHIQLRLGLRYKLKLWTLLYLVFVEPASHEITFRFQQWYIYYIVLPLLPSCVCVLPGKVSSLRFLCTDSRKRENVVKSSQKLFLLFFPCHMQIVLGKVSINIPYTISLICNCNRALSPVSVSPRMTHAKHIPWKFALQIWQYQQYTHSAPWSQSGCSNFKQLPWPKNKIHTYCIQYCEFRQWINLTPQKNREGRTIIGSLASGGSLGMRL